MKNTKRRAICNVHFEIGDLINDLYELNLLPNDKEVLVRILTNMKILLNEAIGAGQAMENRLKEYKAAIESLGFIKDKDGKLKEELEALKSRVFELENLPKEDK